VSVWDIGGSSWLAVPGPGRAKAGPGGAWPGAFSRQSSIIAIISALGRVDLRKIPCYFVDSTMKVFE